MFRTFIGASALALGAASSPGSDAKVAIDPSDLETIAISFIEGFLDEDGTDFSYCVAFGTDVPPAVNQMMMDLKSHTLDKVSDDIEAFVDAVKTAAQFCGVAKTDFSTNMAVLKDCCHGPKEIIAHIASNVGSDSENYIAEQIEVALKGANSKEGDFGAHAFGNAVHRMLFGKTAAKLTAGIDPSDLETMSISFIEGFLDEDGTDFSYCVAFGTDVPPAVNQIITHMKNKTFAKLPADMKQFVDTFQTAAQFCGVAKTDFSTNMAVLKDCCHGRKEIIAHIASNVGGDSESYIAEQIEEALKGAESKEGDFGTHAFGNAVHRMLFGKQMLV